jgi:hypothetical protein
MQRKWNLGDAFTCSKINHFNLHSPINVTCAPPLNWSWYERFDYLFANIAKIDGMPQWC